MTTIISAIPVELFTDVLCLSIGVLGCSYVDVHIPSLIANMVPKIYNIFSVCRKLENQDDKESTTELEHIAEVFNKKSNYLYTILRSSRMVGSQRALFLMRFLLRLNFNSFFERTARGVLNVARPRPTLASTMI